MTASFILLALPAQAADGVRVGLYRYAPPTRLTLSAAGPWHLSSTQAHLVLPAGAAVELVTTGNQVEVRCAGRRLLTGARLTGDAEGPWTLQPAGSPPRRYAGTLRINSLNGRLLPVLTLPLEAYVTTVTGDEMPPDWPAQALGAQALAARSVAEASQGRHGSEGFDYCDLTHCQRFHGLAGADPRVAAAAALTAGRVLGWHGRAITALWHSTCGGTLAANEAVFGGEPRPYLRGGPDRGPAGAAWCEASPFAKPWRVTYGREAIAAALRARGVLGAHEPLVDLAVTDRARDGIALATRVEGNRIRALTGYQLWMALGPSFGWGGLRSPAFDIHGSPGAFTFEGRGLGHEVGLCQWGARGRALAGQDALTIARGYFPGTALIPALSR